MSMPRRPTKDRISASSGGMPRLANTCSQLSRLRVSLSISVPSRSNTAARNGPGGVMGPVKPSG